MTISEAFEVRILVLKGEGKVEKTFKNYRSAKHSLINAVGDIPIGLVGTQQLAMWYTYMKQDGLSDSYVQAQYGKLRSVLGYLIENGRKVMEPRKIKSPKRDTPPKTVLTVNEIQLLIQACKNPRDKAMTALTFFTLARVSEVINIDKKLYLEAPADDKGRKEVVICGKGGKYRPLFINYIAQRYVDEYLDTRRSKNTGKLDCYDPLFMSGQCRRITVSRFEQILHTAAADAGLNKRVTPHVLRHSGTTDLLENHAPIELVSKVLGHSSVAITSKVYSHVGRESQKDMLDQFFTPIV